MNEYMLNKNLSGANLSKQLSASYAAPRNIQHYENFFRQSSNREEGWLDVKISQSGRNSWEKMYILFDNSENGFLQVAKSPSHFSEISTIKIPMERVVSFRTENTQGVMTIVLTTTEYKLSLRSSSRDEIQRWLFTFQKSVALVLSQLITKTTNTGSNFTFENSQSSSFTNQASMMPGISSIGIAVPFDRAVDNINIPTRRNSYLDASTDKNSFIRQDSVSIKPRQESTLFYRQASINNLADYHSHQSFLSGSSPPATIETSSSSSSGSSRSKISHLQSMQNMTASSSVSMNMSDGSSSQYSSFPTISVITLAASPSIPIGHNISAMSRPAGINNGINSSLFTSSSKVVSNAHDALTEKLAGSYKENASPVLEAVMQHFSMDEEAPSDLDSEDEDDEDDEGDDNNSDADNNDEFFFEFDDAQDDERPAGKSKQHSKSPKPHKKKLSKRAASHTNNTHYESPIHHNGSNKSIGKTSPKSYLNSSDVKSPSVLSGYDKISTNNSYTSPPTGGTRLGLGLGGVNTTSPVLSGSYTKNSSSLSSSLSGNGSGKTSSLLTSSLLGSIGKNFSPLNTHQSSGSPVTKKVSLQSWESGSCSKRGPRSSNEDRFVEMNAFTSPSSSSPYMQQDQGYFAVYDGHCGDQAANYLQTELHVSISNHPMFRSDTVQAISETCIATDKTFLALCKQKKWYCGTTALGIFVNKTELIAFNIGDCHAVISNNGLVEEVIEAHKPGRLDESARIHQAKGWISEEKELYVGRLHMMDLSDPLVRDKAKEVNWVTINRVCGELAVSRSIGDPDYKNFTPGAKVDAYFSWPDGHDQVFLADLVIPNPECKVIPMQTTFEFVVLASDGLWDVISDEDAVKIARKALATGKSPNDVAEDLCDLAIRLGSSDNVTVIIVKFIQES